MRTRCFSALLTLFCITSLFSGEVPPQQHPHSNHEHHAMEAGAPALPGHSVFHLESSWLNQDGDTLKLKDLAGKVSVVAMVFTHCEYACPRLLADMNAIEKLVPKTGAHRFILVSIDPDRDTPKVLKAYSKKQQLDSNYWTLLHGDADAILELAAVLGVKYKKLNDGSFSHSNIVHVLDQKGELAYQQKGLGASPGETVRTLQRLIHQKP